MKIDLPGFTLHLGEGYYWIRVLGFGVHVSDDRQIPPVMRNLYSRRGRRRWLGRFVVKGLTP